MPRKETSAHKLLRRLGASGSYLGFYYTAAAIETVMATHENIYQCKWLYNEVAKQFHTTPYCVERDDCGSDLESRKPGAPKGNHPLSL